MNKNTSEAHAPPTPRVRYEFGEKVGGEQMQVEHKNRREKTTRAGQTREQPPSQPN